MLIIKGKCDIEALDFDDLARQVANHEDFPEFLRQVVHEIRLINLPFVMQRAQELVDSFMPVEEADES